jgi:hypothetical protein
MSTTPSTCQHCNLPVIWTHSPGDAAFPAFAHTATGLTACPVRTGPRPARLLEGPLTIDADVTVEAEEYGVSCAAYVARTGLRSALLGVRLTPEGAYEHPVEVQQRGSRGRWFTVTPVGTDDRTGRPLYGRVMLAECAR